MSHKDYYFEIVTTTSNALCGKNFNRKEIFIWLFIFYVNFMGSVFFIQNFPDKTINNV